METSVYVSNPGIIVNSVQPSVSISGLVVWVK